MGWICTYILFISNLSSSIGHDQSQDAQLQAPMKRTVYYAVVSRTGLSGI